MGDAIFTLIFTSALFAFMIYPAMKIVGFFDKKMNFSEKAYNVLTVITTILLAVCAGIFLNYAQF